MITNAPSPTPTRRRQYPADFKAEAVKLVLTQGYSCMAAGRQLGIPFQTLARWVQPQRQQRRQATLAQLDPNDPQVLRARIAQLEAQLRRAEQEREILKKATAYFARENP